MDKENIKNILHLDQLDEEKAIYITNLIHEEDRCVIYDELIKTFGISNITIAKLMDDSTYPKVGLFIKDHEIIYITYLHSIYKYLKERYINEEYKKVEYMNKMKLLDE